MQPPPSQIHLFIVDSDATIAQAIVTLALEAFPHEAETIVAKSASVDGARRLIDRVQTDHGSTVIVVCATELADGSHGLDVLRYVKRKHANTRVVLVTNGERDELLLALREKADGVVAKPHVLKPLRAILSYLGRESGMLQAEEPAGGDVVEVVEQAELQEAVAAMEGALEAVERAHDRLTRAGQPETMAARIALKEAEILAIGAHRRVLDAEQKLLGAAQPSVEA